MEGYLGGGNYIETAIYIHIGERPEGLHHSLLVGLCMVYALDHMAALCKCRVQISMGLAAAGAEVSLIVGAHTAQSLPVILRMNQDIPILGIVHIKNRLQHLVFYLNQTHGPVYTSLIFTGHNGYGITCKPQPLIQDQTVIGAGFWIGLSRQGKALFRNVLPGQDTLNALNL